MSPNDQPHTTPLPPLERLRVALHRAPPDDRKGLQAATAVWAGITTVHVVIWTLVSIIGGGVDGPWWLWFTVPAGAALAVAWWWTAPLPDSRD
jgi:hypothetical protein